MDKKHEIIEATFQLFCEKGYCLSMSEISSAVGIKTPSLYSHFDSKDQLLQIMIHEEIDRYYGCLQEKIAQVDGMSIKEAMKSIFLFIIGYFSECKRLRFWRTISLIPKEQLKSTCVSLIAENDSKYVRQMQQYFMKGVQSGEIRPDVSESEVHLYLCMINGVLDAMLLYPNNFTKNVFTEKIFHAYWEGISSMTKNKSISQ